ncbi:MAG TPA: fibronectin type III domain-containing protein [Candidatus Acidoferrum sp.]|nr:fibronectin type III domain-containing protein [Candidatus Acidoferrum sp.]
MASTPFQPPMRKSLTLSLTWLLAAILFSVTIENIWLDPWLRSRFPDFPSLVPQPPSELWLLTFGSIGIVCVVLMVGQVLLMRREGVPRRSKIVAGVSVILALLLSVTWFLVTSGIIAAPRLLVFRPAPAVKLTWIASATPGVTYNVYRVAESSGKTEKLNTAPIRELAFTDPHPIDGENYTYYVTAVAGTNESAHSNSAKAVIPPS